VTGSGHLVAIDFGSTNTVAVLRSPGGRRRVLLFDGSPLLPSAAYAAPSGELLVGRDAAHMCRDDPARYEPSPKRRVDDGSVLLGGRGIPVVDLVAAVLRRVADEARRTAGTLPPAVLTHPVAWGSARRGLLTEAARRAGLTVLDLVAEPIAAAAYFTTVLGTTPPAGASLAVFDLGGGTFDVAVVRGGGGAGDLRVVGTGGLDDVGGLDLDAAIIGHLGRQLADRAPALWQRLSRPGDAAGLRDRELVWQDVRAAKEMLSRTSAATVHVPGLTAATHLTRTEFEALAGPLLDRAVAETARVVAGCGLAPAQLAGIFLVGGSSRIPLAAHLLHTRLGVAPSVLEQPETAVAEGALHAGAAALAARETDPTPAGMPPLSGIPGSPPHWATPSGPPGQPVSGPPTSGAGVPGAPVSGSPAATPTSGAAGAGRPPSGGPGAGAAARRRPWAKLAVVAAVVVAAILAVSLLAQQHDQARGGDPSGSSSPSAPSGGSSSAGAEAASTGHCPTNAQISQATAKDPGVGDNMTIAVQGNPYCVGDYAYVQLLAMQQGGAEDPASAVLHYANGTWTDVVLGTELCGGEAHPSWATGVPAEIMRKAGCTGN
jgi:hypothetical protein